MEEFGLVGVAGELLDGDDFGAEAHGFAEDGDFGAALDDFAAEGVFGLEAHDEYGIAGVLDVVAEVVEDAAGFAHAGGGDDDHGAAEVVEGLGFGGFADVAEAAEAEGVVVVIEVGGML